MFSTQSDNYDLIGSCFLFVSLSGAELEKPKIGVSGKGLTSNIDFSLNMYINHKGFEFRIVSMKNHSPFQSQLITVPFSPNSSQSLSVPTNQSPFQSQLIKVPFSPN